MPRIKIVAKSDGGIIMKLWIARDKNGELYLYNAIPKEHEEYFVEPRGYYSFPLDKELFPEITFWNSPQQVELKLKNELSFEEMEELIDDLI